MQKKRTFILDDQSSDELPQLDDVENIEEDDDEEEEEEVIDTYDDLYDDIDDIDDLDAFEMDNGLATDKPTPEHAQPTEPETRRLDVPAPASTLLTWDHSPEISQSKNEALPHADDDIRPVPLKRSAVIETNAQPRELTPPRDQDPTASGTSIGPVSPETPEHSRNPAVSLLPADVFAETDKILGVTTAAQSDTPSPDQREETPQPDGYSPPADDPARSFEPEQHVAGEAGQPDKASSEKPSDDPAAAQHLASFETLLFPTEANPPRSEPSGDVLPSLIIAEAPRLRRFAAAMIGDEEDADEIVETTLRLALSNSADSPAIDDLSTALFSALYRGRRERLKRYDPMLVPSLSSSFAATLFRRLQGADRDEIKEFAEAVCSLGEEDRAILILVSLENFSYREIAGILGINVDRVMAQLAQARDQLHHALETTAREPTAEASHPEATSTDVTNRDAMGTDVHGYLDGELSGQRTLRIEDYLDQDRSAAERLIHYGVQGDLIRRLYGPLISRPMPAYMAGRLQAINEKRYRQTNERGPTASTEKGHRKLFLPVLLVILLLAAGGGAIWFFQPALLDRLPGMIEALW